MGVGQRLKSLRLSSGMSLRAVAEIIGVQHGSVSKWENETNNIKRHHLQALSAHFDVSEQWLIFGEEEGQSPRTFLKENSLQTRFDSLEEEDKDFLLDFLARYIAVKKNKKISRLNAKKSN
jgi:transcriptional regulator with XRE-family HTH domain